MKKRIFITGSTDGIGKMVSEILANETHFDVWINNAGIFKSPVENSAQGIDIRLAVNFLAPMYLVDRLGGLLDKAQQPRLINLSSAAQAPVTLDAVTGLRSLGVQEAYAQSKLALTMWSFDLAKKHPQWNVIAVNPGSLLNTKMVKDAYGQHWSPASKGADILYDLALNQEFSESSGLYYDNDMGGFNQAHKDAYDSSKIEALLQAAQEVITKI